LTPLFFTFVFSTLNGFNDFCRDFSSEVSKTPEAYGLTQSEVEDYALLQSAFALAYDMSLSPVTRTPFGVANVRDLRTELTALTRRLVDRCQSAANMTDAKRRALGITIRKSPTRHPVPRTFPTVELRSQRLNTVEFALRDSAQREGRPRKPAGIRGATLYTHLGDHPPTTLSDWTVKGTTTKTVNEISMPDNTPFGATLWIAAAWLNTRLEHGPLGDPASVRLGGGIMQVVAAEATNKEAVVV